MSTTPERRMAAHEEITRALSSRRHAFVIHYVGERFSISPRRITAIAARNLGTGATECFELENELGKAGIDPTVASPEELDHGERRMLDAFYVFVRDHKNYYWLHWNMRNSTFGFPALENRQRTLGGRPVAISDQYRVDLADRMVDLYGDNYADPTNRLRALAIRNKLAIPHLIDGNRQGEALGRRDFAVVTRSLLNRVDVMYAVATKASENSLKTQAPWRDRVAGAGGILKWAKGHPLVIACAIAAPVISVVVGSLKLWSMLKHP